jgi:hypothetical protein
VAASGSRALLVALPVWTGANLALVALEDRLLFPRLFGDDYAKYSSTVPFLLPSRASIRRCLETFALPSLRLPGRRGKSRGQGQDD